MTRTQQGHDDTVTVGWCPGVAAGDCSGGHRTIQPQMERIPRPGCQVRPTANQPDITLCSVSVRSHFDTTGFQCSAWTCSVLCIVLRAIGVYNHVWQHLFGPDAGPRHSCAVRLFSIGTVIICRFKEVYGTMDMHVADTYRTRLAQCFKLQYKQHNVSSPCRPPLLPVMCTCSAFVLRFAAASATV